MILFRRGVCVWLCVPLGTRRMDPDIHWRRADPRSLRSDIACRTCRTRGPDGGSHGSSPRRTCDTFPWRHAARAHLAGPPRLRLALFFFPETRQPSSAARRVAAPLPRRSSRLPSLSRGTAGAGCRSVVSIFASCACVRARAESFLCFVVRRELSHLTPTNFLPVCLVTLFQGLLMSSTLMCTGALRMCSSFSSYKYNINTNNKKQEKTAS